MIQLPAILITLGLAAALVNPEAPRRAEPDSPPAVAINQLAAPAHMTATWPEDILDATRAAKTDIAYTPGDEQTWYFNAGGSPVDQATAGGYYRKALGKTADGRLVVQDYYQDSGKPQTAPFILKKTATRTTLTATTATAKPSGTAKTAAYKASRTTATAKKAAATISTRMAASPYNCQKRMATTTRRTTPTTATSAKSAAACASTTPAAN